MENRIRIHGFLSRRHKRRKIVNCVMIGLLTLATAIALTPLFAVLSFITWKGLPGLSWEFFTSLPVPVGEPGGGMGHALVGSAMLVLIAALVGVPWGIGIGIFLSVYRHTRFANLVRLGCYLLASTPSIIIGLFIYGIIVLPLKHFSALAGSAALSIIMIPTAAKTTEEILLMLPNTIMEAGLGLGLPRWKVILFLVMRAGQKGIITATILAVARIAGETAPLVFTAFSNNFWNFRPDQPTASLPVLIFNYAISPFDEWHQQAWTGAFVLVIFVFAMSMFARFLARLREV